MAGSPKVFGAGPGKEGRAQSIEDRVLKVISHPVRIEILRVLHNRVASPKELARELGESVSNVSYHFKYLRQEGCIEMLDTETRRGAIEHYYRAKTPAAYDVSAVTVRNFTGEAVRALNAGTFDASEDRRLSWMPMELDEQGWRELVERQAEWLEELERIKAAAAERLESEGAPGKHVVAGAIGFETPPGPGFPPS